MPKEKPPEGGKLSNSCDLTTPGNESLLEQLRCNTLEQRLGARPADTVLERLDGREVRDCRDVGQTTKTLVTHALRKLVFHLLIGQILQVIQNQNANHHFG